MVRLSVGPLAVTLVLLSGASSFQLEADNQIRLGGITEDVRKKPLVETEALQALINSDNLLARAEHLYKIAKRSEDEFNRPTRVIGSKGAHPFLIYPT
jgi:aminopeptidase Y